MILDELTMYNFGVYSGRQSIVLTPVSPTKPIILIGGLNGGGKTTLLDAVQLALFGKLAPCSNRGSRSYKSYLRDSIHRSRGSDAKEASVELTFRHNLEGTEHTIHIKRSWEKSGNTVRETLRVARDGSFDAVLTDRWLESVDLFVPLGIARLVFFDGEKIEALADPETSSVALNSALQALLGLDIVDRLDADLRIYERQQLRNLNPDIDQTAIRASEEQLKEISAKRDQLVLEKGELQNRLDKAIMEQKEADEQFERAGGELFEQRKIFEAQEEELKNQGREAERILREMAVDATHPLLLIKELLGAASKRAESEMSADDHLQLEATLKERDQKIITMLRDESVEARVIKKLRSFFDEDLRKHRRSAASKLSAGLPRTSRTRLRGLVDGGFNKMTAALEASLERSQLITLKRTDLARRMENIPDKADIAALLQKRSAARDETERAERSLRAVTYELEKVRGVHAKTTNRYERLLSEAAGQQLEQDDTQRTIKYSKRVRCTLEGFKSVLLQRNMKRISELVLDGLRHLFHKENLIANLSIDPEDFSLTLWKADGQPLSAERLSAGERQLLAVSLIWGLARAAGRPLPAIVDTPLGRLDSSHRMHLVKRYFPNASHQILLLSTDEEINGAYWEELRPRVGRTYRLQHDDNTGATRIEEGYFT